MAASRKFSVDKIAIIGAGPSGLAAAKYLVAQKAFSQIDIFEQQAEVGGVWNYSATPVQVLQVPQTDVLCPPDPPISSADAEAKGDGVARPIFPSPMYEYLYTNIPHELMQYSDQAFPEGVNLYPSRQIVQEYLLKYAEEVRHLIKFSTEVVDVSLRVVDGVDRWDVESRDLLSDSVVKDTYDAIVVATGHYNTIYIPDIPGVAAFNKAHPGIISHSKTYRRPEDYKGKKVLIVGNGVSGIDVALQLRERLGQIPLVSRHSATDAETLEHVGFEEMAEIEEFLIDQRGVRLIDGRVETDLDAVLFCTGYLYTFPCLKTMDPPLVTDGYWVHGLYQHFLHIGHPSLVFPGLPIKAIPFPLVEGQAAVFSRLWANELDMPSREDMLEWERSEAEAHGKKFHVLGKGEDGKLLNSCYHWAMKAKTAGKIPPHWGAEKLWMRSLFHKAKMRFESTGKSAKSLEELGFHFDPESESVGEPAAQDPSARC